MKYLYILLGALGVGGLWVFSMAFFGHLIAETIIALLPA